MILTRRNNIADALRITDMSVYNEDTRGKRIAWARKHMEWTDSDGLRHIGMDQHQFGRRLVTQGTVTGVRNIYVSQLENNHASPSLPMLEKIAEVAGVTVGFLLMEVDRPYPVKEPEPVYFSPEADAAAELIDNAPPEERPRILAVVKALAGAAATTRQVSAMPQHNHFAQRLIDSDRVAQLRNVVGA